MQRWSLVYIMVSLGFTCLMLNIAKHDELFLHCKDYYEIDYRCFIALTYFGLSFWFLSASFNLQKFWFCANDINRCMGDTKHRYVIEKLVVMLI